MTDEIHDFPFFGAGYASYYEIAEVIVRLEREPTANEKTTIEKRVPPPLTDSVEWSGPTLCVSSHQGVHFGIIDGYEIAPDAPDADIDIAQEMEELGMGFSAPSSLLDKFEQDIESWLKATHQLCPVLVAYRREDGEGGGTELSKWHDWSVAQMPELLPHFESILEAPQDAIDRYLLDGLLGMAEAAGVKLSDDLVSWFPGKKERQALESGDQERLRRLLGQGPLSEETLEVLTLDLDDKLRKALLEVSEPILDSSTLSPQAVAQLLHAAAQVSQHDAVNVEQRNRAAAVIERVDREFAEGDKCKLNNYAFDLLKRGDWSSAITFYEILIRHRQTSLSIYCNALYAVQNDNNGLGVEPERHRRFLQACLPYAEENPTILTNAACLYSELGEGERIYEVLSQSLNLGNNEFLMLENEPLFREVFREERFRKLFDRARSGD